MDTNTDHFTPLVLVWDNKIQIVCIIPHYMSSPGVAPPLSKWSGQEVGVAGCGLSVVL